ARCCRRDTSRQLWMARPMLRWGGRRFSMMSRRAIYGIALSVTGAGGVALAQPPAPPLTPTEPSQAPASCPNPQGRCPQAQPQGQAPSATVGEEEHEESWIDTLGFTLSVGGGVEDFVWSGMRDTTGFGGSWNARLAIGTRQYLSFEALYIGSAQSIN